MIMLTLYNYRSQYKFLYGQKKVFTSIKNTFYFQVCIYNKCYFIFSFQIQFHYYFNVCLEQNYSIIVGISLDLSGQFLVSLKDSELLKEWGKKGSPLLPSVQVKGNCPYL